MSLTVESWIEALESGKYEQTTGSLRDIDGHCCLGVACDLSGLGTWSALSGGYFDDDWSHNIDLPPPVQDLLGLSSGDGDFRLDSLPADLLVELRTYLDSDDAVSDLSSLNDNGVPFHLIAKVIRARPQGLFREDDAA